MGWTQTKSCVARDRRRPAPECLETRRLLSTMSKEVAIPAASANNADGSTNFDKIIGSSAARSAFGVDGAGQNVAIIDTGLNYQNAAFGGTVGPGSKVVAGVDFTGSPSGVLPVWQHGTGVAGILAANTSTYQGVAPGAGIISLRVFGDDNQGSFGNIEKALEWVVANHTQYNITAVNLSIADGGNYQSNVFANDGSIGQQITASVKVLESLDIPVVVAAGNSFNGKSQGQSFPAIIPDTISVTATDASDKLASNAQRLGSAAGGASATTLAAPGIGITAPGAGNSFDTSDGTSFATPQVTGTILLLQQMYEKAFGKLPTVDKLEELLKNGATTIKDDVTQIKIGRLNVLGSARLLKKEIESVLGTRATSTPPSTPMTVPVVPTTPPATAPSLTEVFYNGVSIGSYSTTVLSNRYPNLFSFLKSSVGSIRIYGPKGATPDLGASKPSGEPLVKVKAAPKVAHAKANAHEKVKAAPTATPKPSAHRPAKKASRASSSFHS